ncbi:alpha-(1,6)-fucosyltransferase-like isoform X2 [Ruditapes philippinarum]|uniref:alpha-(1,6)-fucosyltransferase-like isoform X2 n=1 Tax=Ruditapes philippinarum TaxID=129788 RepID=UPI00295B3435|nr:alpha-(1,6)-fucosyltransferase-like isoform X2 [Ruditapes philippinarum]
MNRKYAVCVTCFYCFITFIAWSLLCLKQNIRPLKVWNHLDDSRYVDKNQSQSLSFRDKNVTEPVTSMHQNVTVLKTLRDLVQRRLFYLQNPKNCTAAKKIICKPNTFGFGSGLHQVTLCLIVAYATHRTLILESKGWRYAAKGWETVFLPISTNCTSTMNNTVTHTTNLEKIKDKQAIQLPRLMLHVHPQNYFPFAIPDDLADRLERVHSKPEIWWIGQFVDYLIRPNIDLKSYIHKQLDKLNIRRPIVGLHVRRTDKINEANYISLREYMKYADQWFNQHLINNTHTRYIFIATDEPNIIREAQQKYPNYTYVYHEDVINITKGVRYSTSSLKGVLLDVHTLVMCDFVICTMTSNVCRLVHELKESRDGTASERVLSLDVDYIFNQRFRGKLTESKVLHNDTAGLHLRGCSVIKDKRKNPIRPLFTADLNKSRVVMPVYPEVKEII